MSKTESSASHSIFEPLKKIAEWISHPNKKRIYFLKEGSNFDKALLGSKGSSLCEIFRMGLPVPPGFVISTEACLEYFHEGKDSLNKYLIEEYTKAIHELEKQTGKKFGGIPQENWDDLSTEGKVQSQNLFPLLLAIRPGPAYVVPGLTDTILNLGMNEDIVRQLVRSTKNPRFALDTFRRFQMMFGQVILGIPKERFQNVLDQVCLQRNIVNENELSISDLQDIIDNYKTFCNIPADPWTQLQMTITAVFENWFNPRAIAYRDLHNLPTSAGIAITIQSMVFGNFSRSSGSGLVCSRNPDSGIHLLWGEFLLNSEGEEVSKGKSSTLNMTQFQDILPDVHQQLISVTHQLERHFKDMQYIEFTVENGKLFLLESKSGERSPRAACKIAVDMVSEGLLTERDALLRINPKQMDFFLYSTIDPSNYTTGGQPSMEIIEQVIDKGLPGSSGAVIGSIVFTLEDVATFNEQGINTILCITDLNDFDLSLLESIQGVFGTLGTSGGQAAHLMRGMGKPCVMGVSNMIVDLPSKTAKFLNGKTLKLGDTITICGSSGMIYLGKVSTVPAGTDPSFLTVLNWATKYKRMRVLANCDSLSDCRNALELGCDGIGLFRTDQMLTNQSHFDSIICLLLSQNQLERGEYLESILITHRNELLEAFHLLTGKEITISLFNAPISDYLIKYLNTQCLTRISGLLKMNLLECERRIIALTQQCSKFGLRGARLAVIYPEIFILQTRALINAASCIVNEGGNISIKIAIPFVCTDHELYHIVPLIQNVAKSECEKLGFFVNYKIGVILELPRSCVRAGSIANVENIQFVSLDTSNLTSLMFGLSTENQMLPYLNTYMKKHIFASNPFETIDKNGVGAMLNTAISQIRRIKPSCQINICGEHSSDTDSVRYFDDLGITSVSCSPFGVPSSKISAAQATIEAFQREEAEWMDTPYLF